MAAVQSTAPTLVGRREDLAALEAAFEQARGGELVTIVLAGEAGIGKTRLVEEFSERAYAQGARLLSGACVDLGDAALPYGALMDALRDVPATAFAALPAPSRRALAALIPEAAPDDEPSDGGQSAVFGALLRLIEDLGREEPLVLVLEDIHWADRSTEALLRFLVGGLRQTAVLLLLTYRSDELGRDHPVRRLLAELSRAPRERTVVLGPLTRAETGAQLTALAGMPLDDAAVDAIHGRSEGNPFYSEELLAAASATGPVPPTLRDTVLARIDRLPGAARSLARVAAACGRDVDHELLADICGLAGDALDDALRRCVDGHVLAVDPGRDGYRFRHALLQEVALGDLLPGERRRLHGRIADALADRETPRGTAGAQHLAEIAYHRLAATDRPAALIAAVRAAQAAEAVHALAEASRGYDAALELWESVDDPERLVGTDLPTLLERAAECRWLGFGDRDLSPRLRDRASAQLDESGSRLRRADHLSRLATTSCYARVTAGLPLHERALSLLDDDRSSETAARVRARYACVLMLRGDYAEADRQAIAALAAAHAAGSHAQEADALITRAVCRAADGELDVALALLDDARPLVEGGADLRVLQRFYTNSTYILAAFSRYEEAVALAREGIAIEMRAGLDAQGRSGVQENGAWALCLLGRTAEALELLGEDPGAITPETVAVHSRLAEITLAQGDPRAALSRLASLRRTPDLESFMVVPVCTAQAEAALWAGDVAAAVEAARAGEEQLVEAARSDAAPLLAVALRAQADGAHADLLDPAAAAAEADRLLTRLRRISALGRRPIPEVEQLLLVGRAERARLATAPAPGLWAAVAAGWEALCRPREQAYARWRQAEALAGRADARGELEQALLAAHAAATAIGAAHIAHAAERLARRTRVGLPTDPDAEQRIFPELTPREREVLALIADGRTNRQIAAALFIAPKTASVHVSNILGKLGAANRGEAAALAHRAGLVDADEQVGAGSVPSSA
ncbi:MAG TPA: AAA family ATPase [Baekduia sp.]|nr:AAA family ATPase [Baekduia sp.]